MKMFPILDGGDLRAIPWPMIEPHNRQALDNHCGQSLTRLAERGGLSPAEVVAVLDDLPFEKRWPHNTNGFPREDAKSALIEKVKDWEIKVIDAVMSPLK